MKKFLLSLITVLFLTVTTNAQSVNRLDNATPQNLEATIINDTLVLLTWSPVEGTLGYGILLYGEPLGLTSYADTSAQVVVVPEVEFCFTVVSILQIDDNNFPTEISEPSEAACVTTGTLSVEELSHVFNIYPNPVQSELYIATELQVEEISIYDIYGRQALCQQANVSTSQQVIDVSDLGTGIYFVKISTDNGEIVKRFVKK